MRTGLCERSFANGQYFNSCVAFWQISAKRLSFTVIVTNGQLIKKTILEDPPPPEISRRNFWCNTNFWK